MSHQLHIFRIGSDNAGCLIRCDATGRIAAIDAGEAAPVLAEAKRIGWTITDILITHEHPDHIAGVAEVKAATGAQVTGPAAAGAAPLDRVVREGEEVLIGALPFAVWETPGHAPGHLAYVSREAKLALVGDVLFVMGCGRVFGGPPETAQLWAALSRLSTLPNDTRVVTGHDYTLSNARFAAHTEPANAAIAARLKEAEQAKAEGRLLADTTIGEELATNPFLRAGSSEEFAARRAAKNTFR
ncbi:MAG: hydroxyacylglutathione hydrolase [Bosea sp. (in: a-proteobacteria)]